MSSRPVIFWFKRDLRVADNPALARVAEVSGGHVLPLFIFEPEYWRLPDTSARQFAFLTETLADLRADLAAQGQPLVLRTGDAVDVLDALVRETGARALFSSEETGNLWTYARDRRVAAWARGRGLAWTELPQAGVKRRLKSRDGWAAARDRFVRQPTVAAPALAPLSGIATGAMPDAASMGLPADPCPDRQPGGRQAALALLGGFLTERGRDYRRQMSTPVEGEWACSRLSPHLALGALSGREAAQATAARQREVRGTREGWAGSLSSFQSRLAWRDHFMQKLEDEPRIETDCLHPAYEGLRPRTPDATRLSAWERAETGIPFVDACMRYLHHTGWLNFRMRSMLVAVASYHLWLDWRATGPHLARLFTDYEPGIHWSQMQMQSGTTGMNTVRIYNPVKQGLDQDPTGVFTRRWVPELAAVPDAHLQSPWTWEGAGSVLDRAYPAPVVDVAEAARHARDAVWGVRRGDAFRATAARIVEKHASRKDGGDRAPRRRRGPGRAKASPDQLSLDL
ncbi:deoxyribodipyrimidine photolyase [Halovulum dunhuangense]|uniref:Deoxyribodipyrimidine photolyase n=1 Tax=Halovulum dunhuangense TaxID=1505036 RepID=A0A849L1A8_9RHOB|nr:FAD-binding domain-containing protein [Halovulum dunhuangense]NNU80035.1 deoxyribodipyrimidine photolyase [Halovulum dunhuangense]